MPLYSARTRTSPSDNAGSTSSRISPRPGAATQNAWASSGTPTHSVAVQAQLQCRDLTSLNRSIRLHTRLVGAGALGCLIVTGVGFMAQPWLQAGAFYAWKAAALFAAMMAIASAFIGDHPFPRLGPANRVTIVRAMLVALTAGLVGEPETPRVAAAAVVVVAAVALLDGIDGWLARRSRMASAFGARFDMETDALLILALSVLVWRHDKAGAWVLACGLMRYAFVAGGWLLPWMAGPLAPTRRGRTVAVAQIVGLSITLVSIFPPSIGRMVAAATLAALTWSFALDVRRLWRRRASDSGH